MKKLIITCALVAFGSMAFAQSAKSSAAPVKGTTAAAAPANNEAALEKAATKSAKEYQKKLGFSDQQYQAVYQAQLDYIRQEQAMKPHNPGEGQMAQLRMVRDQRMQNALTPDQYVKYQQLNTQPTSAPARTN